MRSFFVKFFYNLAEFCLNIGFYGGYQYFMGFSIELDINHEALDEKTKEDSEN